MKKTESKADEMMIDATVAKGRELIQQYADKVVGDLHRLCIDPKHFIRLMRQSVKARKAV